MNKHTVLRGLALAALTALTATCVSHARHDPAPAAMVASTEPAGQPDVHYLTLISPVDYQVFQRTLPAGGPVLLQGHVDAPAGTRINLEVTTASTPWKVPAATTKPRPDSFERPTPGNQEIIEIPLTLADGGAFSTSIMLGAGGWHSLTVTANTTTETYYLEGHTRYHVGVGEVFVVGGQSNSTNYGEVKQKTTTGYVTVFDGKEWTLAADPLPGVDGKGGGPWCIFGDLMAEKYQMPIGIVPVGKGATSVRQWLPKGEIVTIEPTRNGGLEKLPDGTWRSEGQLYDRMVARMKSLGPGGFRAMLWHQGESDAHQTGGHTLPGTDYRTYLERIIVQSRKEVGWNVPWFVATASWGSVQTPADPDIRQAQQGVSADGIAMAGPDTDTLLGENRQKKGTGVHFSDVGLHNHARLWADVVSKWMETLQK